ncbi:MAG: sporulation protein YabP [Oscillospiraceae bacterium]|nr:sporulation protein YabP [Oscillospiraceae bacterium]
MASYAPEERSMELPHKLTLDGRKLLTMTGVTDVESFDDEMVVLHTNKGTLVIRGTGLHLQLLSLDGGQVHVEGTVNSMTYEDDLAGGSSFFSRLFG